MFKRALYWTSVIFVSYGIVVVIDFYIHTFTFFGKLKNNPIIETDIYAEELQVKPNLRVLSNFDTIASMSLFIPNKLTIMSIDIVDSKIAPVGIKMDGSMDVPVDPKIVGWYKNGPLSGQVGNIVLAGHYDWYNGVKGVFYKLNNVKIGDKITISNDNLALDYIVYETVYVPNDEINAVSVAFRNSTKQELTLITCGGVWDNVSKSYDKRFLVKALLVD